MLGYGFYFGNAEVDQVRNAGWFLGQSSPLNWASDAAWMARSPTTQRIAGSRHSRSASFTSC